MSESTAPNSNSSSAPSPLKLAWTKFTISQRWALGILGFVVLVLPVSLVIIKTQTNWFPKADYVQYPVTSPVTPPTYASPIPSWSPYPSSSPHPSWSPRPRVSPYPSSNNGCIRSGCSGTLCVEAGSNPLITTCDFKPVFSCYQNTACERQSNGQCGFTMTDEAKACIQKYQPPKPFRGYVDIEEDPYFSQLELQSFGPQLKIGRYFTVLTFDFPSTPTLNHDDTISYFDSNRNTIVTTRFGISRSIPGVTNELTPYQYQIIGLDGQGRALITPKDVPNFDKGFLYHFQWNEVSPNPSNNSFSGTFTSISSSGLQADLDNNGVVDLRDFSILSREFLKTQDQYYADLNGDHQVNLLDYSIFVRDYQNQN